MQSRDKRYLKEAIKESTKLKGDIENEFLQELKKEQDEKDRQIQARLKSFQSQTNNVAKVVEAQPRSNIKNGK